MELVIDLSTGESLEREPAHKTKDERRTEMIAAVSAKRYAVETGGIVAMGVSVRTDEVGQSKLTGAIVAFGNDPTMNSVDWEAQPGVWVTLDEATLSGLGVLVAAHVQACFTRARALHTAINLVSNTHADLDTIQAEIETGWPG